MKGFFITGTDTGVGKTWMTAALIHALAGHGYRVAGMKPLACGGHSTSEGWRHQDAELLMQHANVTLPYESVNPYLLREPVAPHIAAAQVGLRLSAAALHEVCTTLEEEMDYVLIEGVGGWEVPLSDDETTAQFARLLGLPVIMASASFLILPFSRASMSSMISLVLPVNLVKPSGVWLTVSRNFL